MTYLGLAFLEILYFLIRIYKEKYKYTKKLLKVYELDGIDFDWMINRIDLCRYNFLLFIGGWSSNVKSCKKKSNKYRFCKKICLNFTKDYL